MNIISYSSAGMPANEVERQKATEASGLLNAVGDPTLMDLARRARIHCRAETALVCAVSHYNIFVIAQDRVRPGVFNRSTSFVSHLIQADADALFVPSAKNDVRFAAYPLVESGDIDFYAAAGMRDEQGYLVGAMCVTSCQPKLDWNIEDQDFLRTCAVDAMQKVSRKSL
jgi:GAF domain-containing protein